MLRYCYDYGDHWALDLVLEAVLPLDRATSPARCVDGDRAAPPDDCGGLRTAEELARVLDDPAHFDALEVNEVLGGPIPRFITGPFTPELVAAVLPLTDDKLGHDIVAGAARPRADARGPARGARSPSCGSSSASEPTGWR